MIKKLFFLILVLLGYSTTLQSKTSGEMPIIAYMGIPDWRTSEEDFKLLSECGFTVSLYPYRSLDLLVKACRYADKYGVKVLARCPEMRDNPILAAKTLKKENGFFGYVLQDEPTIDELPEREKDLLRLKDIDNDHCFYINLLPHYNDSWLSIGSVEKYQRYIRTASAIPCQQISFDHYPITKKGIRKTWYHNLEMVRQESLLTGKPFWAFVLSVPHHVYPAPTQASLRLQIYSNLAYGAQAIQYFTYWTPSVDEGFDYHDGPVTHDGIKTNTYGLVQQMNKELKSIANLFYGAKVTAVHHLGEIPEGTSKQTTMPTNIKFLKIKGSPGAIISQFIKEGHHYLAIVNKSYQDSMKVSIKTKNNIPRHITKELKEQPMKTSYAIAAGDILIVKLK